MRGGKRTAAHVYANPGGRSHAVQSAVPSAVHRTCQRRRCPHWDRWQIATQTAFWHAARGASLPGTSPASVNVRRSAAVFVRSNASSAKLMNWEIASRNAGKLATPGHNAVVFPVPASTTRIRYSRMAMRRNVACGFMIQKRTGYASIVDSALAVLRNYRGVVGCAHQVLGLHFRCLFDVPSWEQPTHPFDGVLKPCNFPRNLGIQSTQRRHTLTRLTGPTRQYADFCRLVAAQLVQPTQKHLQSVPSRTLQFDHIKGRSVVNSPLLWDSAIQLVAQPEVKRKRNTYRHLSTIIK